MKKSTCSFLIASGIFGSAGLFWRGAAGVLFSVSSLICALGALVSSIQEEDEPQKAESGKSRG